MSPNRRIRVLIIDDSAIVRKLLGEVLSAQHDIEVVGTAPDAYVARQKILALKPDVLTLDIEMPRMDGLSFLKRLMQYHPIPVIVVSSLGVTGGEAALEAIRLGAVEVLAKPGGPYSVGDLRAQLPHRVRAAAQARVGRINRQQPTMPASAPTAPPEPIGRISSSSIIAIGASTGGTEAVASVLSRLPENMPPVLVVQHIPPVFSESFAARLDRTSSLSVRQAKHMDEVMPGTVLVAPGDQHMALKTVNGKFYVTLSSDEPVNYHRPSIDVLFESVAREAPKAVGILLTGMGSDGAQGLLSMRKRGAWTIAQDEESCIVFGMPREAIRLGAADRGTPLASIPGLLTRAVQARESRILVPAT